MPQITLSFDFQSARFPPEQPLWSLPPASQSSVTYLFVKANSTHKMTSLISALESRFAEQAKYCEKTGIFWIGLDFFHQLYRKITFVFTFLSLQTHFPPKLAAWFLPSRPQRRLSTSIWAVKTKKSGFAHSNWILASRTSQELSSAWLFVF